MIYNMSFGRRGAGEVDLASDVAIKKFYMLIWKCFYAEYLILLLL
eukprot:COSAG02_NODE_1030_length_15077_cov_36.210119_3_plen_45_part_00